MALSRESYIKAKQILEDVAEVGNSFLAGKEATKENEWQVGYLLLDNPHNGGYESVWTNIENATEEQIEKFNRRKEEVPNSSILDMKGNVTCFGWF